jgi:aspartyl-tRNA(Asn)/glutamyl-tRNA(Gln) amidotransferase subunit B
MSVADFVPVIGLEVHAQLLTESKIFCGCSTAFGAEPNAHTCPVCLGMPGVLPVLNRKVVEYSVRTGLALGCDIRPHSVFSRKNYFYPDLPKGYQISQFDLPICEHGTLSVPLASGEREVRLRRIHMEEDAGKSVHDSSAGGSLVDLNRAGVPLMEIVSEPDLRGPEEAESYLRTLRDVLVYLGVNDGNLEEGSFRCDANVSVMRRDAKELGTRVELKNINSFRFVKEAITYEIGRQVELIEAGGQVTQETRLWDPDRGETRSMRSKEEAHDYRYFPEPDLPPLRLEQSYVDGIRASLPELPRARLARFVTQYGLTEYDARVLTADKALADFYERVVPRLKEPKKVANWFQGELLRLLNESGSTVSSLRFSAQQFTVLLGQVEGGQLSGNAAKEVFGEMFKTGKDPLAIVSERGLAQVSDVSALEAAVDEVLGRAEKEVASYRAGKTQVLGFLMGQVMKSLKGKGNPAVVSEILKKKLGA